jgi:hypothetical protein
MFGNRGRFNGNLTHVFADILLCVNAGRRQHDTGQRQPGNKGKRGLHGVSPVFLLSNINKVLQVGVKDYAIIVG